VFQAVMVAAALWSQVGLAALPLPAGGSVKSDQFTHFGVFLDAGVPDGAAVSLAYRPYKFLRLHAGITDNLMGLGGRAGASLSFYFPITPSLNFDVGKYFTGDVSRFAHSSNPTPPVTYSYANLQLGLEVGSPKYFMSFIRGGLRYLNGGVKDLDWAFQSSGKAGNNVTAGPATISGIIPSAKLGFAIFFL
jgi:hypothetical protein